ncbi:FRG domain-containing protein [Arsenicicoccus cauae]|uniref:FRG domain-containing protein n=1 Tax=Arsenicicoccus cauae TaxID=2663847 RepID=UPI00370CFF33
MTTIDWESSGWGLRISSVDELMRLVSRLTLTRVLGERIVWRGVRCASWRIESSLQRAIRTDPDYYEAARHERGPDLLRQAERSLITLARDWGIGANNGAFHTDLQVLATLQHHGVPTRLLDVTTDPVTALWFACAFPPSRGEDESEDAALFAFATAGEEELTMTVPEGTVSELDDGLAWSLNQALSAGASRPVLVRPAFPDARMLAQSGRFLIGQPASQAPEGAADDERCVNPIPGLRAVTYDQVEASSSGPSLRALLEHEKPSEPVHIPFAAVVIPRALVREVCEVVLDQYDKTYRALLPDPAGLADAVRQQAVRLPQWAPRHGPTVSDGFMKKLDDRVDEQMRAIGPL